MEAGEEPRSFRRARGELIERSLSAAKLLCVAALLLTGSVAAGWIGDLPLLTQGYPSLPPTQPVTALGLALGAIALLVAGRGAPGRVRVSIAALLAAAILLLGLLTLSEYVLGWNAEIDLRLIDGVAARSPPFAGRPAPSTSLNFVLLGIALLSRGSGFVSVFAGQTCAIAMAANATIVLTGYILGAGQPYGLPVYAAAVGMAVQTSIGFILLALALLLARPGQGVMTLAVSDTRSGAMARGALLAALLGPPLIGVLTRIGVIAGWYGVSVHVSLFAVLTIGLILWSTWQAARRSEQEELRAEAAFDAARRANQSLRRAIEEREVFAALIENSPDFIGIADPAGKPVYLNPAGRRLVGLAPDFPIERTGIPDYYSVDQRAHASDVIVKSMLERGHWQGETSFRHWQTEEAIPVSDTHFTIREPGSERLLGLGTITRDISELKRSREQLRQSQEELRLSEARSTGIVSISADAIICTDQDQRITLINGGAERIFGYAKDEVIGASLDVLLPERFRAAHRRHVEQFAASPEVARRMGQRGAEICGLRKDGEEFHADASISKLDVDGKRIFTIALRDITEDRRIENEQRFLAEVGAELGSTLEYEETLTRVAGLAVRGFADFCIEGIVEENGEVWRVKAACRDPSQAWACDRLTGLSLDRGRPHLVRSVLEMKQSLLIERLSPEMVASLSQSDEHSRALGALDLQSLIALPLLVRGKLLGAIAFLRSGASKPYEAVDLRLAEQLAERAALSIEHARLYRVAQDAIRARDDVLAIVSHDLRNPLGTAALVAELLRDSEGMDAGGLRELGDTIQRSIDQMLPLIDDLLDLVQIEKGAFSVDRSAHDPREVVIPVIDAIRFQAERQRRSLEVDLPETLPRVFCDARRIGQVISNLVGNAIKFTPEGGRILVSAEQRGAEVVVSVSDTGPGIAREHQARVFDRFWQAQEKPIPGKRLGAGHGQGHRRSTRRTDLGG